jgi:short-subunit dehydrogenase
MKFETALVTGGTTGIGEALVRQLIAEGCRVVFCARNQEKIDALAAELGERAIGIQADVSDPARAEAVVHEAEEILGGLDLLIANAGRGYNVHGSKMKVEDITSVLQLNVMGATATIAAGIESMVKRKRGHLVGISSIAGNRGLPTSASYCASKACFSTFLESLRVDLKKSQVSVTDIRPGFIDTPLTKKNKFDMPFLMSADRAAHLILKAIRKKKAVYTFPWQMAAGAWILRRVPNWLFDFFLSRASPSNPKR